ncbi:ABC transporter [Blautia sp. An249]|uniref:ABC transporter ATP-binding protein n=1 Tax=Blautia sp. An249 TaxID=1965603 RepID=UPI000B381E6A|nr:energy-coupling factor ABC transporter ATP-binding protein [Blautia sp. An249]OUO77564.1 ABC transporter [Blautia sp. An249]
MIEFKDVSFQYEQGDSKGKIENINLTIHDGEAVLICGESGCGKTTLTRLINGLIPHYYEGTLTGQTIVQGIDVKNGSLYSLSGVVGSVFQNPRTQFFTVDTTSEIAFGCENIGIDAGEISSRIENTVNALKIKDLLNRSLFALSGGEKQKIACASVSAMEPDIFVLDEPSSNLDIKSIRELKNVLREWKSQGKTIVIAEHRLYYLMDIADRVLYMQNGRIKANLSISDFRKKSTDELHSLGLRALQSENFSKMQSVVCATKQLYFRDFEASYKNASEGKKKKRKVLDISDLMVPQGSVVGVVGNNGAGKTTFAHNLCGLLQKAKGSMTMNGKTYMASQRIKACYMVMQDVNHQLFTESVMDEILLSLDYSDEEKALLEANRIMESLHISEYKDAHPMSLSGGQKQRVAIASAIASDKQVIIFDEPTSGLDYRHMKKVAENLRELSSLGKTLFIVTHDPELIAECCNYFVFIENGKVLWSDGWNRISRERLKRFFAFEGN